MKKKFLKIINCIVIILFCIGSNNISFCQSDSKTVMFDWQAQSFDNSLPFDEPFKIQIKNIDINVDTLSLKILRLGDADANQILIDSKYYEKLPGQQLTFYIQKGLPVTSVEFAKLEPNKHYVMIFFGTRIQQPSPKEQSSFALFIKNNVEFKNEIKNVLKQNGYFDQDTALIVAEINKYVKLFNSNYFFDTSTLRKNPDILFPIYVAKASQNTAAKKIQEVKTNLDKTITELKKPELLNRFKTKIKDLEPLIPSDDKIDTPIPYLQNHSFDQYIEQYKMILDEIKQIDSAFWSLVKGNIFLQDESIDKAQQDADAAIQNIADNIASNLAEPGSIFVLYNLNNSIPGTLESKASVYISQSAGAGYSIRTGNILSYLTYSFFFRPVNQEIALSTYSKKNFLAVRLCLNAGITLNNISSNKNGVISGILGDKAIVLGGGFRLLSFLKFDMNGLLYYLNDPNPLINHKRLNCSPMIGFSLNLNIAKLLAGEPNPLTDLQKFK